MAESLKPITAIFVTVLVLCSYTSAFCPPGTYVFQPRWGGKVCDECPRGTYMPDDNHTHTQCYHCTLIWDNTTEILIKPCDRIQDSVVECKEGYYRRPPFNEWQTRYTCEQCTEIEDAELEILIKECDKTHDAVILCNESYYRRRPRNEREKERCEKCRKCSDDGVYMMNLCQNYTDTQCCSEPHMVVHPNKDGVLVCSQTPWLCRQGQYFNTDPYIYACDPCPDGTFMNSDYHTMTKCLPCPPVTEPYDLPKYAVAVSPCNKTHPPLIECQQGYYIKYGIGFNNENIGCSRCKMCDENDGEYEGRGCDRFHDTVCCPQPNMTVSNTKDGPSCGGIDSKETHGDSMATLHSNSTGEFTHHQGNQNENLTVRNDENEEKEVASETDDDADSKGRDLSPGETAAITLSVFFIIFIVIIVFVVIRYRPWPLKVRNCLSSSTRDEHDVEDGTELDERSPLLEDTRGQHPVRQEILISKIQEKSRDPPQLIYLPVFEVTEPKPITFEGCVTVMKDGDLSFYIEGYGDIDRSMASDWQVSVMNETEEKINKTLSLEKFILPREDVDLNDTNSVIIKNDYLRDNSGQLPDTVRVIWDVTMEDVGHGASQKLVMKCKLWPL